jgi:hypothetical protein
MPGWRAAFPRPRDAAGSVLSLPSLHEGGALPAIRFLILWAIRSRIGFRLTVSSSERTARMLRGSRGARMVSGVAQAEM